MAVGTIASRGTGFLRTAAFGAVLGVGAVGDAFNLGQHRAQHRLRAAAGPTRVDLGVNATMVAVDLVLLALLPDRLAVAGLAAGHATSFAVGLVVCSFVLSRRVRRGRGPLGGPHGGPLPARRRRSRAGRPAAGPRRRRRARAGTAGALVAVAAGGAVLAGGYLLLTRRLHVPEVEQALGPVLRRVRR